MRSWALVILVSSVICSGCSSSGLSAPCDTADYPDYLQEQAKQLGAHPREILNLASLIPQNIEKDDMRRVSSVYHNRLRRGMSFEFVNEVESIRDGDPATMAVMSCVPSDVSPRGIVKISRKSVEAALQPVASSYLYYCKDVSGHLTFFHTFREFEKFVSKSLPGSLSQGVAVR